MLEALISTGGVCEKSRTSKTSTGTRLVNTRVIQASHTLPPKDNAKAAVTQGDDNNNETRFCETQGTKLRKPVKLIPTTTLFDLERESRRRELSTTIGRSSTSRRSSSRSSSQRRGASYEQLMRNNPNNNGSMNFTKRLEAQERILRENERIAYKLVNVKPMVPSFNHIYKRDKAWDRIRKNLAAGTKNV